MAPCLQDDTEEWADFRREPWRAAVLGVFVLLVAAGVLIYIL